MKKLKIGITTEHFINWGGGIDFIRLLLNGLNLIQEKKQYNIHLFVYIPFQSKFEITLKNLVKKSINQFLSEKFQLNNNVNIDLPLIIEAFKNVNPSITIVKYDGLQKNLEKKAIKEDLDLLLPLSTPLASDFPIKWVGYIFDFQHKYYPYFFTDEEIKDRDENFLNMMKEAKQVIVNAKDVKKDIEKFIEIKNAKIISLPFCPVLNLDFFDVIDISKYNLPDKYFMISNQFWKHKDHITAFKAFKAFIEVTGNNEIGLVCTGQTEDYRFPNYFSELEELITNLKLNNRISILGYIPKKHQLQILKNTIAVIQPTLFEGGPGGGAVYESVAYGIPSIVSDIPVNLELDDESIVFFNAGSSVDLMEKMELIYHKPNVKYTLGELVNKNEKRMLAMGEQIMNLLIN